jgi:hypothetical protein
VLAGAVLVGGCQEKHVARTHIQLKSIYATLPPRKVPDFLKGTVLEKCDLINTDGFPISGYGLVVNLADTGGTQAPNRVREYMVNQMINRKIGSRLTSVTTPQAEEMLRDPRVAIVRVDGYLPPGVRKGEPFDVQVSALPESGTTSLAGGELFETDLRIDGANPNDPGGAVNVFGRASGQIFVNPAYALSNNSDDPAAQRSLRFGVIMNGAQSLQDRAISLRLRQPEMRLSRFIESRIDERFQEVRPDTIASARDEGIVDLYVPAAYQGDWAHFSGVVQHLYLNATPEFSAEKARQLCAEAVKPGAPLMDISYCLEGLGQSALPAIREAGLMSNKNPDIAFAAARAAAYLKDPAAPQALVQMARTTGNKFQVDAVQVLGSLPKSPAIDEMLRPLLDSPDTLVRIEAYKMLAANGDNSIFSVDTPGGFTLDIVRSSGPPIIYATRRGTPRLAVIGARASLRLPVSYLTMDDRLSITSDFNNRFVTIFYRPPMPKAGPRDPQQAAMVQPIKVQSRPDIVELVSRLAGVGSEEHPGQGLHFNYGEILSILSNLSAKEQLYAMTGGKDQQASFILQDLPRAQNSIYNAPVIPDQGRPQTAPPEKVGLAK